LRQRSRRASSRTSSVRATCLASGTKGWRSMSPCGARTHFRSSLKSLMSSGSRPTNQATASSSCIATCASTLMPHGTSPVRLQPSQVKSRAPWEHAHVTSGRGVRCTRREGCYGVIGTRSRSGGDGGGAAPGVAASRAPAPTRSRALPILTRRSVGSLLRTSTPISAADKRG